MKSEAMINVIRYDYINKKPVLTYEQLIQLKKELKEEHSNTSILKLVIKQ